MRPRNLYLGFAHWAALILIATPEWVSASPLFRSLYYSSPIPAPAASITVADFDGDSIADVIAGVSGAISFCPGLGDLTFGDPREIAHRSGNAEVISADLNHDDLLDLVASWSTDSSVWVYLGTGGANFSAGTMLEARGLHPAIGDLDADDSPDLVVTRGDTQNAGKVTVWMGHGDGTFSANGQAAVRVQPTAVVIADLTADGYPEVIVTHVGTSVSNGILSVLPGNGDGSFGTRTDYNAGFEARSVAVGDMNLDGQADIVVGSRNSIAVFLNLGGGALGSPLIRGNQGLKVALGYFDADPYLNVAAVGGDFSTFYPELGILRGSASGALGYFEYVPLSNSSTVIATADFNADGKLDLVGAGESLRVYPGNGDGSLGWGLLSSALDLTSVVAVADLNGDHVKDVVLGTKAWQHPDSVVTFMGRGDGRFDRRSSVGYGDDHNDIRVVDVNADGIPDVVTVDGVDLYNGVGRGYLTSYLGTGTGTLVPLSRFQLGYNSASLAIADFNEDGRPDYAVTNNYDFEGAGILSILLGTASGPGAPFDVTLAPSPHGIAAGDFDHDGHRDLVVGVGTTLVLLKGTGTGTFWTGPVIALPGRPSVVSADFNEDGNLDIAMGISSEVTVYLGDGTGNFSPSALLSPVGSGGLHAADMNGDGHMDVVGSGAVFRGLGNGQFGAPEFFLAGTFAIGDVNNDGWPDLVVYIRPSHMGGQIMTLLNTTTGPPPAGVDSPAHSPNRIELRAPSPNPLIGELSVSFVNPMRGDAALEVYDVTGRRLIVHRLRSLDAGIHQARLAPAGALSPGVYTVRLGISGATVSRKVCILR